MLKKDTFAPRPPMGWNSWDCYGAAVNEEQLLGNAEYVRDNLKDFGWEYIVCDIQWYEPKATSNFYNNFTELCMDEYSRLIPAVNRFPSSANGVGFKAIADKIDLGAILLPVKDKDIDLITGQYTFIALLLFFFRRIAIKDLSMYIKELYSSKGFAIENKDLIYASAVRRLFKEGLIKKEESRENDKLYLLTDKGLYFVDKLLSNVNIENRTRVIDGIRLQILEKSINN